MPEKWDRASIAKSVSQGVNRNFKHDKGCGAIFGYAVISKMRLRDNDDCRNWEMDDKSLDQVIELGNASKIGIKSRFGHPNMSSTAFGTFLGRAKNFRRDGDLVRADLFFDQTAYSTPNGDLASYVMDLAENDPDAFGSSIVFSADYEYRLNADGTPKKDDKGKDLPALVRFKKLRGSDIVDEPAANKSMFESFFNGSVELSAKATQFLDNLLNSSDALNRVIGFLNRYRENSEDEKMPKELTLTAEIDTSKVSETIQMLSVEAFVDALKSNNEALLSVLKSQGFASPDEVKTLQGQIDSLSVKIGTLEHESLKAKKAKRILEFKDQLNSIEALGDISATATMIATLEEVDPELAKQMLHQEKVKAETFKTMGFDTEVGSSQGKPASEIASLKALKAKQTELMNNNLQLSKSAAWRLAIKNNPDMYKEYVSSQSKRPPITGGLEE